MDKPLVIQRNLFKKVVQPGKEKQVVLVDPLTDKADDFRLALVGEEK